MTMPRHEDGVRLAIRPSRQAIGRVGGSVHLLIQAEPPAQPVRADRRPVALALVIDRSGSMSGPASNSGSTGSSGTPQLRRTARDTGTIDKLSFVKAATHRLLDLIQDGDAVALITFDDTVNVVKPLTVLDSRSRGALASAVKSIETGGSTFLEGGFRSGLAQFTHEARQRYGCKLVLLSDGEANVGEQRPAVLAEVAAGAAHNAITTSTLGVGFDYNIALMSTVAEAGNGDFSHIHALEALDEILREEFTTAAEVTARSVAVTLELPERVAFGTNLNSYRQESTQAGFKVFLGDLVRTKEFLFEITTPVPLEGDQLGVHANASYRDAEDRPQDAAAAAAIKVCAAEDALKELIDDEVIGKLLLQLPAQAEMATVLAYEAGDFTRASTEVDASRAALADLRRQYGSAVTSRAEMGTWEARLTHLAASAEARLFSAPDLKTMYAASYDLSRSRPIRRPGQGGPMK
jgi:Ca-activated chloride channel homolog